MIFRSMKIIFNIYYSLFTDLVKINEIVSDSGKFKYLRYFKRNNSLLFGGFPGDSVVKNLHASAGDASSIPGSGRAPGEGNGYTHSSVLTWRIPWTDEPGRLQSMGLLKSRTQLSN